MTSDPNPSPALNRGERRRWMVFALAMLFVVYLAGSLILQISNAGRTAATAKANKALADCTALWAQTTSDRSTIVAEYNQQSNTAFTEYTSIPASRVTEKAQALAVYRLAQAALTRQLVLHPPPKYTCDRRPPVVVKPSFTLPVPVLPTITATHTHTVTAPGATSTSVVTVPGEVQTQVIPGRTATVTVHRTVTKVRTKTVAPPSCLTHPAPPCVLVIK